MKNQLLSLVMIAALGAVSCGETPTEPSPTPESSAPVFVPPAPEPPAPPVVVAPPEPFCPYRVVDSLDATQAGQKLIVMWNPTFGPEGKSQYLRRYQIEVQGTAPTVILEVEVRSLTGTDKVEVERTIVGKASRVSVRAWYPNECHGPEGNRLNTPWAGPVNVYHRN